MSLAFYDATAKVGRWVLREPFWVEMPPTGYEIVFLYSLFIMTPHFQIRADYDRDSIVVYQAYRDAIAKPAIREGRFVEPFSWQRMTWIKPSFLWMMARCNWTKKSGQENVLAIRIKRTGFDQALTLGVLTMFDQDVHPSESEWRKEFESADVHVQWDPERSVHGKKLLHRSIQVGLSRAVIRQYTDDWILEIKDCTQFARKLREQYLAGNQKRVKQLIPRERVYPVVDIAVGQRLGMDG